MKVLILGFSGFLKSNIDVVFTLILNCKFAIVHNTLII